MNSNTQLAILAAGGAAVYIATKNGGSTTATPTTGVKSTRTKNVGSISTAIKRGVSQELLQRLGQVNNPSKSGNGSSSGYTKEVEEQIKADLKRQWEAASAQTKIEICNRLKKQFPSDPAIQSMNCAAAASMTFQTIVTTVAAAAGFALCGPPCSVVGALVAAWGGPKLEEYAKKAGNYLKDLGSEALESLEFWNW